MGAIIAVHTGVALNKYGCHWAGCRHSSQWFGNINKPDTSPASLGKFLYNSLFDHFYGNITDFLNYYVYGKYAISGWTNVVGTHPFFTPMTPAEYSINIKLTSLGSLERSFVDATAIYWPMPPNRPETWTDELIPNGCYEEQFDWVYVFGDVCMIIFDCRDHENIKLIDIINLLEKADIDWKERYGNLG